MRFGRSGVQRQRVVGQSRGFVDVGLVDLDAEPVEQRAHRGHLRERLRECRVLQRCLRVQLQCSWPDDGRVGVACFSLAHVVAGLQVQVVGLGISRRRRAQRTLFRRGQLRLERIRNLLRHIAFDAEDVVERARVGFGPQMRTLSASINCTLISTELPAFCTLPSRIVATPSCCAIVFKSPRWLLYFSVEVREMTFSSPMFASLVRIISCMPLAK